MNASVVQNVNLAPMSVEEMQNTNGGILPIVVGCVLAIAALSSCGSARVIVKPPTSTKQAEDSSANNPNNHPPHP